MSKQSLAASSVSDIKYNTLTQSGSSKDLSVSGFSSQKLQEHSGSGKTYIPTSIYLQQIEDKYTKQEAKKLHKQNKNQRLPSANSSEFMLQNQDNQSHISNYNHNDIPLKFKTVGRPILVQTEKIQKPPTQQAVIPQLTIPKANVRDTANFSVQQSNLQYSNVRPEMEMHIPEDLSLSKGVSERGLFNFNVIDNNVQQSKQNVKEIQQKQKFFELSQKLKQQLPRGHKGKDILIDVMYHQAQNIPEAQWPDWIQKQLQA